MKRFFVDDINGDIAYASPRESAHIIKVIRLKKDDEAYIFDGKNNCYKAVIIDDNPNRVKFKIKETIESNTESPLDITVYQAIIKNDKFDYVIQKCVELGVNQIQPFTSRFCVKKPKNPQTFIERANNIALEASKQCGRNTVPEVLPIIDINQIADTLPDNCLCLFLYEREEYTTLKSIITDYKNLFIDKPKIAIIAGSEGGFDLPEAEFLIRNGAKSVSLGKRILRAETASPAVLAMLLYEFEL